MFFLCCYFILDCILAYCRFTDQKTCSSRVWCCHVLCAPRPKKRKGPSAEKVGGLTRLMVQKSGVYQPVEVGSLSHYLQDFLNSRWCRIFSINSSSFLYFSIFTVNTWSRFLSGWCFQEKRVRFLADRSSVFLPSTPGSCGLEQLVTRGARWCLSWTFQRMKVGSCDLQLPHVLWCQFVEIHAWCAALRERERFGSKTGCILCKLVFFLGQPKTGWLQTGAVTGLDLWEQKCDEWWNFWKVMRWNLTRCGLGRLGSWNLKFGSWCSHFQYAVRYAPQHVTQHATWVMSKIVTQTKSRSLKSANQNFIDTLGQSGQSWSNTGDISQKQKKDLCPMAGDSALGLGLRRS